MTHEDKITWMALWASKNRVTLDLAGSVGFGRDCVGVVSHGTYPDYIWYDEDYNRIDPNGEVWCPENAYHKHTCVAVLGHGEKSEAQLYDWLKWFDDNGFTVEVGEVQRSRPFDPIELMLGKHVFVRMVRA